MKALALTGLCGALIATWPSCSGCASVKKRLKAATSAQEQPPAQTLQAASRPPRPPADARSAARTPAEPGEKQVPLRLRASSAAHAVPIRSGVPFPYGVLSSVEHLRLENADGSEIPAQFDVLAKWPDDSLKVVLVQLVDDVGPAKNYRLLYGNGVKRAEPSRRIVTAQKDGALSVDTGVVRFSLNDRGVLDGLWQGSERLIDGGDIFLSNALDDKEYNAASAKKASITLEESGPVRAVARVEGRLLDAQGQSHMKYLARYYASVGSDKVDVELTLIDDRLEENVEHAPSTLAIAAKSVGMRWHRPSEAVGSLRFGKEGGGEHAVSGPGEHYLLQTGEFRYVDGDFKDYQFAYSGVGNGKKAPGWLALSDGARHLTLEVRDFWQQFPSELRVDGANLSAVLFSSRGVTGAIDTKPIEPSGKVYRRPNSFYFPTAGGAKTYQLRLSAPREQPSTAALEALDANYQRHELDLVATPEWYTASGVWGELSVGGPNSPSAGYDAALLSDIYVPSFQRGNGLANQFGFRDYGDRLRGGWADVKNGLRIASFYNDTHVGANSFFKQFLRSGDQRWFQLGETATRHVMDIDVSHGPRQGYWKTGGRPQPAGELRCGNHENVDHDARNLHWGHAHVSGMSELYLLTGDKRSLDVLREMAGWWRFVTPYFFPAKFDAKEQFREAERDFGWPLYVMNEYVRVSGDAEYQRDVAGELVDYLLQWWQTPLDHVGYDPVSNTVSNRVLGVNDASKGSGYWTMSRMDNSGPADKATGTNPWMAGALLSNLIKFYEQDMQFAAAGKGSGISHAKLRDMLLQAQNYVVKYGYDKSRKLFVYSEAMRDGEGEYMHIIYGLAYLDRLFKRELADKQLPHPEWYDTQPLWSPIAERYYQQLKNQPEGRQTLSNGFYGYEMVYPPDFFAIMSESKR